VEGEGAGKSAKRQTREQDKQHIQERIAMSYLMSSMRLNIQNSRIKCGERGILELIGPTVQDYLLV
jgi:hypothetical protein